MTINKDFLKIINEHQNIFHKICNVYCDNKEDKEDLFQEILLQLLKSFPRFRGESKVTTWLYSVALNTALTRNRNKSKRPETTAFDLRLFDRQEPHNIEEQERSAQLHAAIQLLNDVEKAIVSLYMEDMSYKEIADITGISESNVGVRLNRIKDKLRNIIKKAEYGA